MIAIIDAFAASLAGWLSAPSFAVVLLLKATLLLALGTLVATIAHRFGAATRHSILGVTLGAALVLPLAMIATPAWRVGILPQTAADSRTAGSAVSASLGVGKSAAISVRGGTDARTISNTPLAGIGEENQPGLTTVSGLRDVVVELWAALLWLTGACAVLAWMAVGRVGLRRIGRRANALDSLEWQQLLASERARCRVESPVALKSSAMVSTPLTWGMRAPIILLPAEAAGWNAEHRAVVLRHELAHIARNDSLMQMLAGFACALYWFHPLAWLSARKLRAEQERACDDRVLSSGTPAAEYAAHLLEVARSARALGAHGLVSLAMARPSQLEGRLLAVLNGSSRRARVSPLVRVLGGVTAILAFVALSAFRPMPRASALHVAVQPTIIATQFVPPRSPIAAGPSASTEWSPPASNARFDSTFEKTVDVPAGGTLVLDLETGAALTIGSWNQQRVRVKGTLEGRDWRDTEVKLDRTTSGARLRTQYVGSSNSRSSSHHFNIMVPKHFNIRISSAGGGITMTGVEGVVTGNTGGGAIRIAKANGRAEITTGGGSVRVSDSNLSGSVSTGGGTVLIENVRGGLKGHSGSSTAVYINSDSKASGSGGGVTINDDDGGVTVSGRGANVTIDESSGRITDLASGQIFYRKPGGGITLAEAKNGADVRTGGGPIRIGRSAGKVIASTGGGDIRIGPLDGSAVASTGAGDVRINVIGAGDHSVDVTSGNGKVILVLPADFSGVLELETAYTNNFGRRTSIESSWPLSPSESSQWDDTQGTPRKYIRAHRAIGSGSGVVRVRTVNGDIVVQRGQ